VDRGITSLFEAYPTELSVKERKGDWDKKQTVQLSSASQPIVPGKTHHDFKNEVTMAIHEKAEEKLRLILSNLGNDVAWKDLRSSFIRAAISERHLPAIKILLSAFGDRLEFSPSESASWLQEAVKKEFYEALDFFLELGISVNNRTEDSGGQTPLHFAARRSDLKMMAYLIRKGADPTLASTIGRTPLQLLALKDFSVGAARLEGSQLDFSKFLNQAILSDLTVRIFRPIPFGCTGG